MGTRPECQGGKVRVRVIVVEERDVGDGDKGNQRLSDDTYIAE